MSGLCIWSERILAPGVMTDFCQNLDRFTVRYETLHPSQPRVPAGSPWHPRAGVQALLSLPRGPQGHWQT